MGFQGDTGRKAFAEMVGIDDETLATYESGQRVAPLHHAHRILGAFNAWAMEHYESQEKLVEDVYDVLDKLKSEPPGPGTKH